MAWRLPHKNIGRRAQRLCATRSEQPTDAAPDELND